MFYFRLVAVELPLEQMLHDCKTMEYFLTLLSIYKVNVLTRNCSSHSLTLTYFPVFGASFSPLYLQSDTTFELKSSVSFVFLALQKGYSDSCQFRVYIYLTNFEDSLALADNILSAFTEP